MPNREKRNRLNDMRGIESIAGIDKLATTKVMNSTKIPPEQRNDLRELLVTVFGHRRGSLTARERNPLCLFCGEEPEDEEHMLLEVPAVGNASPGPHNVAYFWRTPNL